jgi:hypothetical protein
MVLLPLIAIVDMAAVAGTLKWLLKAKPSNNQTAIEVSHGG